MFALGVSGTLPWTSDTERRTLFFKYSIYGGKSGRPGDNCAFYDTTDPHLTAT
eukprot:SAG31_NODE_19175_length_610_cov_0.808219_1_plen_52_part_01